VFIIASIYAIFWVIPNDGKIVIPNIPVPLANKANESNKWEQKVEVLDPQGAEVISCKDGKSELDLSHIKKGIVLLRVKNPGDSEIKIVVEKKIVEAGEKMNRVYPYDPNVEYQLINLVDGKGKYHLTVYNVKKDGEATEISSFKFENTNADGIEPFSYPTTHVYYSDESSFIKDGITASITKTCKTTEEAIAKVISWVSENITYNPELIDEKVKNNETIFDPDITYKNKEGICGDLAVLSAAMLRSIGIPTKLHYGYIVKYPDGEYIYHAWIEANNNGRWHVYDPTIGIDTVIGKQIPHERVYLEPSETF